jgi:Phage tail protein (Tail_P2_I)
MWRTIDLVPDSIASDPQVIAACEAIDIELAQIYEEIPPINFWPNVEQQSGAMLDVMMWEMHVDIWQNWNASLTDDDKIQLILDSIDWHQHKGTPAVVEEMIDKVFGPGVATLVEWFEYRGDGTSASIPVGNPNPAPGMPVGPGWRYKFRIDVDPDLNLTPEQLDILTRAVLAVKNLRSWIEEIGKFRKTKNQLYEGEYKRFRNLTKIYMSQRIAPLIEGIDYYGVGTHSRHIYGIGAPAYP